MKILIVASDKGGHFSPFIEEQSAALQQQGCEVLRFGITGHGTMGYLRSLPALKKFIREQQPDLIHAHYGLSCLLASMQRLVPVVSTYHGSDIHDPHILPLSRLAMRRSAWNIFVSKTALSIAQNERFLLSPVCLERCTVLPCGVDLQAVKMLNKEDARKELHLPLEKTLVLFSGAFDNAVKDAPLAKKAMAELADAQLIELKGYSREEVFLLMQAADVLLLTSRSEGSPQVVKEAMACGCPIVSTDVGDVRELTAGIAGCYVVSSREPSELAALLREALAFARESELDKHESDAGQAQSGRTNGRMRLIEKGYTNDRIARQLMEIYTSVLSSRLQK